jgi:heme-degrading monooxygenase HmoA
MIYILWEFQVKSGKTAEFERRYGSQGDWAALFRRSPAYHGTTLGRSINAKGHYWVTDQWESAASFATFKRDFREAYQQLDLLCEELTIEEKHLGDFEVL